MSQVHNLTGHDVLIPVARREEARAYLDEHHEIVWDYDWVHGDGRSDPPEVRAQARFVFANLEHADAFQDRFGARAGIVVFPQPEGVFLVSEDQTWVPGIYATEDAARLAPTVDPIRLGELVDAGQRGIGDDYRPVTLAEVQALAIAIKSFTAEITLFGSELGRKGPTVGKEWRTVISLGTANYSARMVAYDACFEPGKTTLAEVTLLDQEAVSLFTHDVRFNLREAHVVGSGVVQG